MDPKLMLALAIKPALVILGTRNIPNDSKSTLEVLTIAKQEGGWRYRQQIGGPAHSYWQFERGGVSGVFNHVASRDHLAAVCSMLDIPHDVESIYQAMVWNDVLAACMALLLLWTDAGPMPEVGDVQGGWNIYQRNWRPGAPHPENWPANYAAAQAVL